MSQASWSASLCNPRARLTRLKEADFEPEAVLNWLFLLGLSSHAFDQEFYLMEDMLTRVRSRRDPPRTIDCWQFSIDSFSTHRAILEHSKLVHLNGIHLQHKAKLLLNAEDVDARLAKRACKTVAEQLPLAFVISSILLSS